MSEKFNVNYVSADGESYILKNPLHKLNKKLALRTLSQADFNFWQQYGYIVVKNAISKDRADTLFKTACEFQSLDPNDQSTWYPDKSFNSELEEQLYIYGFVEMYQHQLMWDIRQEQRIYDAFVDVWDIESLWVTLDRINLNPPNVKNRCRSQIAPTKRGFDINLHWDVDTTSQLVPQRVQGILALTDSDATTGGFQCCPSLFEQYDSWVLNQPDDRDPVRPNVDPKDFPIVRPELEAGDLLIFNGWLAHGVEQNLSKDQIRSVFYLSMMPELSGNQHLTASRVDSWENLTTPCWNKTLIGDQTKHEKLRYGAAELTELGEKLLGLKSWQEES